MYDSHGSHPLLAQVPLTVSPFISLPSAVTLPYTYRTVPSTLPPSVTVTPGLEGKPQYVVSSSGHAARPEEIRNSCMKLQEHVQKMQTDAKMVMKEWEDGIKERELAEKRRVAPGWLDRDEKMLEPTKAARPAQQQNLLDGGDEDLQNGAVPAAISPNREGEELDRAFGGLSTK